MLIRIIGLGFATLNLFCGLSEANGQIYAPNTVFNNAKIGPWKLEATTRVVPGRLPRIADIECEGRTPDVSFSRSRGGRSSFELRHESGRRHQNFNIDLVTIQGRKFAIKAISTKFPNQFSNIQYPDDCPKDDCIVIDDFRGYLAAEFTSGVWLPATDLLPIVLKNRTIKLRYRQLKKDCGGKEECAISDPILSGTWMPIWVKIDVSRLDEAIKWCDGAIHSPLASVYKKQSD